MMLPRVLNKKMHGIPPNAKYIGRGTPYGNESVIGRDGDRNAVCDKFEEEQLPSMNVEGLRGFDLVCHCDPLRCHGHSIFKKLYGISYRDHLMSLQFSDDVGRET